MSTITASRSEAASISWTKVVVLTLVIALIAFFLSPNAPLGTFWRPDAHIPAPTSVELPFLILLNVIEVLAFGFGIAFPVEGNQRPQHLP